MRKWHRWISLFLFLPLAFIAATGLLSQWAVLWPTDEVSVVPKAQAHEGEEAAASTAATLAAAAAPAVAPAANGAPAGFVCPEGWSCRPPRAESGPRAWTGFFHHLHSGEEFGTIGTVISILSGFGLLFFSISGIWVYAQMWLNRRERGARDRWFWK